MAAPLTDRSNVGAAVGVVTRIDGDGRPYVEVDRVARGFEFGPVLSAAGDLEAGDRVVVAFVDGLPDSLVIMGRVPGPRGIGEAGPTGDVVGPAAAVDGNLAAFNGTTGELLADSGLATSALAALLSGVLGVDLKVEHTGATGFTVKSTSGGPATMTIDAPTGQAGSVTFRIGGADVGFFAANGANLGLYSASGKLLGSINATSSVVTLGNTTGALQSGATIPAVDDNTTKLATTAWYTAQRGTATPLVNGTATAGTSKRFASADHVHPTDTSRAAATHTHAFAGTWDAIEGNVPVT